MIDGMQEQARWLSFVDKIRFVENRVRYRQCRLTIACAFRFQVVAEAQQALGSNRRRGRINRLPVIVRVGRSALVISESMQVAARRCPTSARRRRRIRDVKIRRRLRRAFKNDATVLSLLMSTEKLKLLGEAADGPRQPARPRAERRVTLLRVGAAVVPIVGVENALVRRAAAHIVGVASFAVINRELRGGSRVLRSMRSSSEISAVPFAHQHVTELMRHCQRAQGTHRVDEQRVRAVEGIDVAFAAGDLCPSRGLHRARNFQRQFVKMALVVIVLETSFAHQRQQFP